jgi:hypothetical protein
MFTKNIEVSCFANYKTPHNPITVNLFNWLNCSKHRKEVERIRSTTDKEEKKRLKAMLPAITPSGIFTERKRSALVEHSGLICLDIDLQDNTTISNYDDLSTELIKLNNVAYCGRSVSGTGLFVLIPIAYPERHESHFKALQLDFEAFGIIIDEKCKDVCRLRGYSYDNGDYFNFTATPYTKLMDTKQRKPKAVERRYTERHREPHNDVELLIDKIVKTRTDITTDYNTWIALASAMASTFGERGRDYFHTISQYYPSYDTNETDRTYNYVRAKNYTADIGVFFKACKLNNILFDRSAVPS